MNKRKAKFRSKVTKYHDEWKNLLALSWWKHEIAFFDHMTNVDGTSPLAECTVNWQYQEYTININEYDLCKQDNVALKRIILHELLHVVVAEMREGDLKHEERVVTLLQNSIIYMLDQRKEKHGKEI